MRNLSRCDPTRGELSHRAVDVVRIEIYRPAEVVAVAKLDLAGV
jgi:hypothetical protein